jgi:hypothetical protein
LAGEAPAQGPLQAPRRPPLRRSHCVAVTSSVSGAPGEAPGSTVAAPKAWPHEAVMLTSTASVRMSRTRRYALQCAKAGE